MTEKTRDSEIGVHAGHCCVLHGCRYSYGPGKCPVETGEVDQEYPCEQCCGDPFADEPDPQRFVLVSEIKRYARWALEGSKACEVRDEVIGLLRRFPQMTVALGDDVELFRVHDGWVVQYHSNRKSFTHLEDALGEFAEHVAKLQELETKDS